ncbi:hypothetical protein GPECTOR_2g1128 [Gonium pectorale]|uniref:Uncharacterized protein n=1 Tax=Gonium pectorale TaxID=33097 RepID=A0A150H0D3_GONPE|nr:hypothetical protein GPECTOR_2g1128 [Gonium pectorale]|eukprot:KXZ55579.1 hypothetical protein GPECTOR_2g1128 [Gonium pectorale]
MKSMNSKLGKLSKQVNRLETRVSELYEFTCLPLISNQFSTDFAESVDMRSAAHVVDHILSLALNLDVPALKSRPALINILEEQVLKERAGLRAALKSLIDEACDEQGVCMVALPSNFQTASWDDIRACLSELQLGFTFDGGAAGGPFSSPSLGRGLASAAPPRGSGSAIDERLSNLMRLVDALETGPPPRPLPGFMECATALAGGPTASHVALDCRGRIDVRETYIEFHIGAFKGSSTGLPETCAQLKRAAALLVWAYRVLEPHIYSFGGRKERDVEAIGYAFTVGKVPPADSLLKLYDDFSVDLGGRRSNADIAYRYFSVRPTGVHEHYAKV